ncbi:hypothetical protein BU23DRAFT_653604 [Bimuria novae-zelandiae CBS 107.79]|uniref:Acid protease n=1 Tax=Bimuria novae-zelandiae CBS 107.79 TaxID=1447943 RepID=A0A6A5UW15_9PLEO|nr:hypothetical protein BU23DRAFT_653604 [Bimuria novae-zelandiae CBS 107.79]
MNLSPVAACLCYYVLSLMVSFAFAAPSSFVVPWGTAKFGPDGPWQAVKVTLGGNDSTIGIKAQNVTEVSVYPGGVWSTKSFTKAACKEYPNSLCGAGGTWDPDPDQLALQRIGFTEDWIIDEAGLNVSDIRYIALGLTIQGSTTKTVWNASLSTCDIGHITYPNGIQGGVPLGSLSLGASEEYQTFSLNDRPSDNINAALFPAQLHKEGDTPSYSYGLHIGSASFDYPGSLAFGGYNKGRVIGPVTSFRNETAVDLLDIGIGVEYGASPFAFDAKEELLSTGTTKALPNPLAPYLSLPGTTCENIAKLLPVTYDVSLRYYLWNTHDPLYTKIVSSPAYLSFSFPPSPGHTDNVVIKVPFALLNLTLEHPITDSPKQYFPCVPYERGIVLGRAFLQAAFLGRNWIEGTSWLAQAPGPGPAREGLGEQYTNIEENDAIIEGFEGEGLFNQSWAGHWSIVASQKNNETKPDDTKPEGRTLNGCESWDWCWCCCWCCCFVWLVRMGLAERICALQGHPAAVRDIR